MQILRPSRFGSAAFSRRTTMASGIRVPKSFSRIQRAERADGIGATPIRMGTLTPASSSRAAYLRATPVSMQNCVWTKSAPAATLARRPLGSQSGGGSIGMSAAPSRMSSFPAISVPDGSLWVRRMRSAIASSPLLSRSNTGLASGWSPAFGSSPASISMLRMPSASAPRMSPCSASRLRSRQVIWTIGSMPFCTRKCAAARLERCTLAPAPSVTFTAVATPLSGSARLRNSPGSVDTAGVISAVTTKSPACSLAWRLVAIYDRGLPELPDLTVYLESLESRIANRRLLRAVPLNPFFLRTAVPPLASSEGCRVQGLRRLGKRIVIELEGELYLVLHLMIAGRLKWDEKRDDKPPRKIALALLEFENGTLAVTEAGTKRRASLHLVQGKAALDAMDPGGIEIFESDVRTFGQVLSGENHTLKRALTDPHLFAGIGNAYSDEILHRARLSPIAMTKSLSEAEVERLYAATREVLREWVERLRARTGAGFPEKVTAFREEMAVHGRYGKPCPVCGAPVQRIVYAENETNYCARCQTGGRILADRALSRLLKKSWPRSIDDLG